MAACRSSAQQRHSAQAGHDVPRALRLDVLQRDATEVPYCTVWLVRTLVCCMCPQSRLCPSTSRRGAAADAAQVGS